MKKLLTAQSKYESEIGSIEAVLFEKVDFEFFIMWQPSDGFVMVAFDRYNAPLEKLLKVIEREGILIKEEYLKNTI